MSDIDQITEDYSREQVPESQSVHGLRIALVIIGFAITLPLMLTGSRLGLSLGLENSIIAFATGGLMLAVLAVFIAIVGSNAKVSTYKIIEVPFGVLGARVVNIVLAVTLFGWYGVTAALFGDAAHQAFLDILNVRVPVAIYTVFGSALMVGVTVFGFKALDKLSVIVVPLLLIFLFCLVYYSLDGQDLGQLSTATEEVSVGVAISVVVGSYIVGATILPDLCRYAKSPAHAVAAVAVSLGVALPFILLVSAIPSLVTGSADLVKIMMDLGMGTPALLMIVFATWTSNANNLYSTSLGLATVFTRYAKWKITVVAGILCTLVAVSGLADYFVPFLLTLGIAIPPIAGIYIADYYFVSGKDHYRNLGDSPVQGIGVPAFVAWVFSIAVAASTANEVFTFTTIPACDSLVSALIIYLVLKKVKLPRILLGGVQSAEKEK